MSNCIGTNIDFLQTIVCCRITNQFAKGKGTSFSNPTPFECWDFCCKPKTRPTHHADQADAWYARLAQGIAWFEGTWQAPRLYDW
jgi:hypothetical protein